ncbi:hypothetical protein [Pseudomonas savastanoi]|uniref:hypothetical protein n=1 Tax=Pseudomonas savastanoi TaxID=29438 RepID=UPI001CE2A1B6|nr:hypothetical protein [Pseudomonas savastanoi]
MWKREIRCATQFLDFYLKDTSASRENVAAQPLADLAFKQPKAIGFLTDAELEWVLKSLPNFIGVHEFRIIEMYLIMARCNDLQSKWPRPAIIAFFDRD